MKLAFSGGLLSLAALSVTSLSVTAAPTYDPTFELDIPHPYTYYNSSKKRMMQSGDGGYFMVGTNKEYNLPSPCSPYQITEKLRGDIMFRFDYGFHKLYRLIKVNENGKMDCGFQLWAYSAGSVTGPVLPDSQGGVYVAAGSSNVLLYSSETAPFTYHQERYSIARFFEGSGDLDGDFDLAPSPAVGEYVGGSFEPPLAKWLYSNWIQEIALERPDGPARPGLIVGGIYQEENGGPYQNIWRIEPEGGIHNNRRFQPVALNVNNYYNYGHITKIEVLPSGKILVAGGFNDVEGSPNYRSLIRLNSDGTLDTTFQVAVGDSGYSGFLHGTSTESVQDFVIQPDGKIIVAGQFTKTVDGRKITNIVRLHEDGSVDTSFNVDKYYLYPHTVALQADGKVIIASKTSYNASTGIGPLVRLNADGSLDESFRVKFANGVLQVASAKFDSQCRLMTVLELNNNAAPTMELPSGEVISLPSGVIRLLLEDSPGCIH